MSWENATTILLIYYGAFSGTFVCFCDEKVLGRHNSKLRHFTKYDFEEVFLLPVTMIFGSIIFVSISKHLGFGGISPLDIFLWIIVTLSIKAIVFITYFIIRHKNYRDVQQEVFIQTLMGNNNS